MAKLSARSHEVDAHGHRKFYDFEFVDETLHSLLCSKGVEEGEDATKLIKHLRDNIIGADYTFKGPFGLRKVLYCDYIASGKALTFIEDYIRNEVLPAYANTHTTTSVTGLQTTLFRHEARQIIRDCVNAGEHDAVIFTGSGCTGAVHLLLNAFNFASDVLPVVIAGPYDHHSTLLPWREITKDVHQIGMTEEGLFDMGELHVLLKKYAKSKRVLIGCMSAASNVTGNLLPVDDITICLHKAGALALWDYAMAAPYVELNMNPYRGGCLAPYPYLEDEFLLCFISYVGDDQQYIYKDAIFLSPHKFLGGPGCPGILIAKKTLFSNPVPSNCGGGTVFFVRREHHTYLKEIEAREEGGTPDIIGSIRAGMVFQLKRAVGVSTIVAREKQLYHRALEAWKGVEGLVILGNTAADRLPVFSLVFSLGNKLLHHNYGAALLDDLFGIQSRGGCACAGPYAEELLGIDEKLATKIEDTLIEDSRLDRTHLRRTKEYSDKEIIRPGFVRLNLPYFMSDDEIEFVIEAVKMVASEGWKLLPRYLFNPTTGEWKVRHHEVFEDRKWLGAISYAGGTMTYSHVKHDSSLVPDYKRTLKLAKELFSSVNVPGPSPVDQRLMFSDTDLLWFVLPSEAIDLLSGNLKIPLRDSYVFKPAVFEPPHTGGVKPAKPGLSGKSDGPIRAVTCELNSQSSALITNSPSKADSAKLEDNDKPKACKSQQNGALNGSASGANGPSTSKSGGAVESTPPSVPLSVPPSGSTGSTKTGDGPSTSNGEGRVENVPQSESGSDAKPALQKRKPSKWQKIPRKILTLFIKAVEDFDMIHNKDKILVCLSGGKDSLSLLHAMKQYQHIARSKGIEFSMGAVTVDPGSTAYDPRPLIPYLAELQVPYFYEEQGIMKLAGNLEGGCDSICAFCSRMKRGRIYKCARDNGYNVLALGQHLDDLAESFMMSTFHNGLLRTMKANYTVTEGDLRVIRPLVYIREKSLRDFAESNKLPIIAENCPACFEQPKERHRIKQLLASQEIMFPDLYKSILSSLRPLMAIDESEMTLAKSLSKVKDRKQKPASTATNGQVSHDSQAMSGMKRIANSDIGLALEHL